MQQPELYVHLPNVVRAVRVPHSQEYGAAIEWLESLPYPDAAREGWTVTVDADEGPYVSYSIWNRTVLVARVKPGMWIIIGNDRYWAVDPAYFQKNYVRTEQ